MKTVNHFIDGKIYSDKKSRKAPIFNPAIGEQIAEVELASKATVEMAIESSAKAFLKWSKTTTINRARILSKYKDLLIKSEHWGSIEGILERVLELDKAVKLLYTPE